MNKVRVNTIKLIIEFITNIFVASILIVLFLSPNLHSEQSDINNKRNNLTSIQSSKNFYVPTTREEIKLSFAPLVQKTYRSVVSIVAIKQVTARETPFFIDPFFGKFFGFGLRDTPNQREVPLNGSGVIVSKDGYVITNDHVVGESDRVKVVLSNRREYDAKIVISDKATDLAVLKLVVEEGETFDYINVGDSDYLQVGDLVVAIGNPFQVGQTVTTGIVSALARTGVGLSNYRSYVQTDAAINPGNSGGALINVAGELVGINSAIYSSSGGSLGIGFAVPSRMVMRILDAAYNKSQFRKAWLDFKPGIITQQLMEALSLPNPLGVIIEEIYSQNGPAKAASMKAGDIILKARGRVVNDPQDLRFVIASEKPGKIIKLSGIRNGRHHSWNYKVILPPELPAKQTVLGYNFLDGARLINLSPAIAQDFSLPENSRGIIIENVEKNKTANKIGFQKGDILLEINNIHLINTSYISRALQKYSRGRFKIKIIRDNKLRSFNLEI